MNLEGILAVIFMVFIFGVFLAIPVLIILAIIKTITNTAKQAQKLLAWVESAGYSLSFDASGLKDSSFNNGFIQSGIQGSLKQSGNKFNLFLQSETRGSGKSTKTYLRTIAAVDVPDTQLQMVVNSRLNNNESHGGNLERYSKEQRFALEGDFGEFFDVYMPNMTQSETLTILAPNSMVYIMKELADYDIEINGKKLYVYAYKHLQIEQMDVLIQKIEGLLKEVRLRKDDVRKEKITNALVAHTATDSGASKRSLKRDIGWLSIAIVALIIILQVVSDSVYAIVMFLIFVFSFGRLIYDAANNARLRRKYKAVISRYS